MSSYLKNATSPANQREALPGQQENSAGGQTFVVNDDVRLERFLILGSEGGSYYATERKLTRENAAVVDRLAQDRRSGLRAVEVVAAISQAGRAPKNDPAILALAILARSPIEEVRKAAYAALPQVCRIGTHLLHFVAFANDLGGWGRGLRRAVGRWFNDKKPSDLAYQLVKYQSRDGWAARDCLRLSHPTPATEDHKALYRWATSGYDACGIDQLVLPPIVEAFEEVKKADISAKRLCQLIRDFKLPRECVPSNQQGNPEVQEAMLPHMGITALVRNLGNLTKSRLVAPLSTATSIVLAKLGDKEEILRSRVHPVQILQAHIQYGSGRSLRGDGNWQPVQSVVDALDAAFYTAFGNVPSTGKPTLLAIDVSGSMDGGMCAGMPGISPRIGAAAMALVTANVEPNHHLLGFSAGGAYATLRGPTGLTNLQISPHMRLAQVVQAMQRVSMGGTDCALPFLWAKDALKTGARVENFAVYTDNETWAGSIHPHVALRNYRQASGLPARSAVVGMVANVFTVADPNDAGMMDVCGFDSAAPAAMAAFFASGGE